MSLVGEKIKATPADKAKPLAHEFMNYRQAAFELARGYRFDQFAVRKCRIECKETGGCWRCEKWYPELKNGERTGLCLERVNGVILRGEKKNVDKTKTVSNRSYK